MTPLFWDIQDCLYDAIRQDTVLQAFLGSPARIYDAPPQTPVFPYVQMGDTNALTVVSSFSEHMENKCQLHVFSRYRGMKEIKDIAREIHRVLHHKTFASLAPYHIDTSVTALRFMLLNDGLTYEAQIDVSFLMEGME